MHLVYNGWRQGLGEVGLATWSASLHTSQGCQAKLERCGTCMLSTCFCQCLQGNEVMTVVLHAQQGAQKLGMQQSKLLCALAPVAGHKNHTSQP